MHNARDCARRSARVRAREHLARRRVASRLGREIRSASRNGPANATRYARKDLLYAMGGVFVHVINPMYFNIIPLFCRAMPLAEHRDNKNKFIAVVARMHRVWMRRSDAMDAETTINYKRQFLNSAVVRIDRLRQCQSSSAVSPMRINAARRGFIGA